MRQASWEIGLSLTDYRKKPVCEGNNVRNHYSCESCLSLNFTFIRLLIKVPLSNIYIIKGVRHFRGMLQSIYHMGFKQQGFNISAKNKNNEKGFSSFFSLLNKSRDISGNNIISLVSLAFLRSELQDPARFQLKFTMLPSTAVVSKYHFCIYFSLRNNCLEKPQSQSDSKYPNPSCFGVFHL